MNKVQDDKYLEIKNNIDIIELIEDDFPIVYDYMNENKKIIIRGATINNKKTLFIKNWESEELFKNFIISKWDKIKNKKNKYILFNKSVWEMTDKEPMYYIIKNESKYYLTLLEYLPCNDMLNSFRADEYELALKILLLYNNECKDYIKAVTEKIHYERIDFSKAITYDEKLFKEMSINIKIVCNKLFNDLYMTFPSHIHKIIEKTKDNITTEIINRLWKKYKYKIIASDNMNKYITDEIIFYLSEKTMNQPC